MSRLETVRELLARDRRTRGRVLDAGTGGGHMTAILAGFGPAELVSVSVDETAFPLARANLPPVADADRVSFVLGDLADPEVLAGACFDLVVGDYLLASAAGHRPFRETELLAGLVRVLAPGGLLILTGMEPLEPCRTPEQEVVRALLRWWTALTYLGGEEMYREVPAWWTADRLREAAARAGVALDVAEPLHTRPLTWSLARLRGLAKDATHRAAVSGDDRLAAFARAHLGKLLRRAGRMPALASGEGRVAWGRDWVVRAERPLMAPGPHHEASGGS